MKCKSTSLLLVIFRSSFKIYFHFRNSGNEHVDVETIGHTPPLFYNSAKINENIETDEMPDFEDNWMDKVD